MRKLQVTKEDLNNILDALTINLPDIVKYLDEFVKALKNLDNPTEYCKMVVMSNFDCKNDVMYFTNVRKAVKKYLDYIPLIRSKLDTFPESFEVDNDDLNTMALLFSIDVGIVFNNILPEVLSFTIDVLYGGRTKKELDENFTMLYKDMAKKIKEVAEVTQLVNLGNLEEIIEKIGSYPVEKKGFFTKIKTMLSKFLRKEVGIKNNINLNYITEKIKVVNDDSIGTTNFTGNPIYHFRKFLVDLELKKLESLKDRKRLIELKLTELKQKQQGNPDDPKLKKQIEYYENKLEQIEHKIDVIVNG